MGQVAIPADAGYFLENEIHLLSSDKGQRQNASHQRAGAIRFDFKTGPTAGSAACDCYFAFGRRVVHSFASSANRTPIEFLSRANEIKYCDPNGVISRIRL